MIKGIPCVTLPNSPDGYTIPAIGFGVAAMEPELLEDSIKYAAGAGYTYFDCAPEYGNEIEVGDALRKSGIPREKLFISTKLEGRDHSFAKAIAACEYSMRNLGVDYLDCYLIHWPMPAQDLYLEAWRALERLYKDGKVRVIGLSNFKQHHINRVIESCSVKPMVNELEINPYNTQDELRIYSQKRGIHVVNWFPLGGPANPLHPYPIKNYKVLMKDPLLEKIGKRYGKSIGQVALRWAVEKGITPIPKSSKPTRIAENRDIFDFSLTGEEIQSIDKLNHNRQMGPDGDTYNEYIDLTEYDKRCAEL